MVKSSQSFKHSNFEGSILTAVVGEQLVVRLGYSQLRTDSYARNQPSDLDANDDSVVPNRLSCH